MSGDLLVSMMEDFTRLFGPCDLSPVEEDYYDRRAKAREQQSAHVAVRSRELAAQYAQDDEKIGLAVEDVSLDLLTKHRALVQAIKAKDQAEVGRLLCEAITPLLADRAIDAAEEEADELFPLPEE